MAIFKVEIGKSKVTYLWRHGVYLVERPWYYFLFDIYRISDGEGIKWVVLEFVLGDSKVWITKKLWQAKNE